MKRQVVSPVRVSQEVGCFQNQSSAADPGVAPNASRKRDTTGAAMMKKMKRQWAY